MSKNARIILQTLLLPEVSKSKYKYVKGNLHHHGVEVSIVTLVVD